MLRTSALFSVVPGVSFVVAKAPTNASACAAWREGRGVRERERGVGTLFASSRGTRHGVATVCQCKVPAKQGQQSNAVRTVVFVPRTARRVDGTLHESAVLLWLDLEAVTTWAPYLGTIGESLPSSFPSSLSFASHRTCSMKRRGIKSS